MYIFISREKAVHNGIEPLLIFGLSSLHYLRYAKVHLGW